MPQIFHRSAAPPSRTVPSNELVGGWWLRLGVPNCELGIPNWDLGVGSWELAVINPYWKRGTHDSFVDGRRVGSWNAYGRRRVRPGAAVGRARPGRTCWRAGRRRAAARVTQSDAGAAGRGRHHPRTEPRRDGNAAGADARRDSEPAHTRAEG